MNDFVALSRPADDMEMARQVRPIIEQMLGGGHSVLDPTTTIWTAEAAHELRHRIADNPIQGNETQWSKLEQQLQGAPRQVVLLAAEMVLLREHPIHMARPQTRRGHVEQVLAISPDPPAIPEAVANWMSTQSPAGFKPGQGYNGALWRHLIWFAQFIEHWHQVAPDVRAEALQDPWTMQRVMLESGEDRSDFRNALQFLIRPDVFEPISSQNMKVAICSGLADRLEEAVGQEPENVDKQLLAIRTSLAREGRAPFHFWSPGVAELWGSLPTRPDEELEPRGVHYWLFAPGPDAIYWQDHQENGLMALGWDNIGDFAQYTSKEAIRDALDTDAAGLSYMHDKLAIWQFQHDMQPGDIVFAKRGGKHIVGRGRVISQSRYEPERESYRNVRSVEWTHTGRWPNPGGAIVKTLTDITGKTGYVEQLEALFDETPELTPAPKEADGYAKEDFLRDVYMSAERYDRLRSLLLRKKNVILAGPPGVGKTYAARRLAFSVMGEKDTSRIQSVQFHQSYSYEDFVMGYRPNAEGGFDLVEGPFYSFCERAREDSERDYFFIIDEINRGNLSKIFGELLMLIEADKRDGQGLRMLYNNEVFSVPANVHIIGMMNTADRSLAVLDYALRRRFGFFEMAPGFDTAQFRRFIEAEDSSAFSALVEALQALNHEISQDPGLGRGFAIGHSYLSAKEASRSDDLWLLSVVEDELVPLLEEYWFDQPERAQQWGLTLRGALDA